MQARVSDLSPLQLNRGELYRMPPVKTQWPAAYYVGCPRCATTILARNHHNGLIIDESVDGFVTFSAAVQCHHCQVLIHVQRCQLILEEDCSAQHAQYR